MKREASGPSRAARDAPRRNAKMVPPPPPGSAARKALEDKRIEPREAAGEDEPPELPRPPNLPAGRPPPVPARPKAPMAAKPRAPRSGEPIDLSSVPEADRTKENRGAVGIKHDKSASLTANAASGTIGGDTPPPIFDRAAIAAGPRGALAGNRPPSPGAVPTEAPPGGNAGTGPAGRLGFPGAVPTEAPPGGNAGTGPVGRLGSPVPGTAGPGDAVPQRTADRNPSGKLAPAGTGPTPSGRTPNGPRMPREAKSRDASPAGEDDGHGENAAARGTPQPGSLLDRVPPSPVGAAPESPAPAAPAAPLAPNASGTDRAPATPARSIDSGPQRRDDRSHLAARVPLADTLPDATPRLAVPVGEFDHGETVLEQDKLRIAHAQATIVRDAANALLGLPEAANPAARLAPAEVFGEETVRRAPGDPAFNDASGSSTGRFERGDPTLGDSRGDATTLTPPAAGHAPTGTLRSSAALPRRRGIAGDFRYVATVVFGLRRARRELDDLAARQATRQQSRRHHLVTLGRAAVTADGLDHPALAASREQLTTVEDERSQHAGHVIAADAELTRVSRDREAKARQCVTDLANLDSELAALTRKLEPLDKEVAGIKKRGIDLHESLRRIDARIAATEASLTDLKGGKLDRAEVQAELATLRAERKSIQSDEPAIAGQLDALNPRIAALEAARAEAQRKRTELAAAEQNDQRRVEELLAAIGAKRKVVDRAAADAEARRDKILFQLGERLYVDRPDDLTAELAPIDEIDLELGSADRRMMELREIVASVDRWKLVRGVAMMALILAAIGAAAGWRLGLWP